MQKKNVITTNPQLRICHGSQAAYLVCFCHIKEKASKRGKLGWGEETIVKGIKPPEMQFSLLTLAP
jgi:hypothetical protein